MKNIKKIIRIIITYLIVKTKIILIFERRIFKYRSLKYKNKSFIPYLKYNTFDYHLSTTFYFKEYYSKLKDPKKQRAISFKTLSNGEGLYWAKHYYYGSIGKIHRDNRTTIYTETENLINDKKLNNSNNYFINLGSSSGLDLKFFKDKFKNINYLSTDINKEIIDFQKEVTFKDYQNIKYFIGSSEEVIEHLMQDDIKIINKNFIIFCNGTLQYEIPFYFRILFAKLKLLNNNFYFCLSEHERKSNNELKSFHIKNILWQHYYIGLIDNYDFKTLSIKKQGNDKLNQNINIIFSNT